MDKDDLLREARQQSDEARDEFRQAHKMGMEAFERGDFQAVMQAIHAEFDAIENLKRQPSTWPGTFRTRPDENNGHRSSAPASLRSDHLYG